MSVDRPNILELLKNIDVLVDGKFRMEQKSLNLKFRGSKNQRIIDVAKSLKEKKACLIEKYISEKSYKPLATKNKHIYI